MQKSTLHESKDIHTHPRGKTYVGTTHTDSVATHRERRLASVCTVSTILYMFIT
jgi:hypothetical protein